MGIHAPRTGPSASTNATSAHKRMNQLLVAVKIRRAPIPRPTRLEVTQYLPRPEVINNLCQMGLERFTVNAQRQKQYDQMNQQYQDNIDNRIRKEEAEKAAIKNKRMSMFGIKKAQPPPRDIIMISAGGHKHPRHSSQSFSSLSNKSATGSHTSSAETTSTDITTPDMGPELQKEPSTMDEDRLIKAMVANNTRTRLTGLPSNVLTNITHHVTDVDIFCLRQTSHKALRTFDMDKPEFTQFHHPGGYNALSAHAYANPWTETALRDKEEVDDLASRLEHDLFCDNCQTAKQSPDYQQRLKELGRLIHCSACNCDHPMVLFSADQRRASPTSRICIGWEGHVRVCRHLSLTYQDVVDNTPKLARLMDNTKKFGCSAHEPDEEPINDSRPNGQSNFAPTAYLKQQSWTVNSGTTMSAACPSKQTEYAEPTLAIRWDANLAFDISAKDCTPDNLRKWLSNVSAKAIGNIMCPHMSFTDKSIEAMWGPQKCVCVTYPGAEKITGEELHPARNLGLMDCRKKGCPTTYKPFAPGHGDHTTSCRICNSQLSIVGSDYGPCSDDVPYRIRLEYKTEVKPVPNATSIGWLMLIDPSSYGITSDEDAKNVTWCNDSKCANFHRLHRITRVLKHYTKDAFRYKCSETRKCPGVQRWFETGR